jgi:hypothetical protein
MGDQTNPFDAVQAMMLENLEKVQVATQATSTWLQGPWKAFRVPM